MSCQLPARQPIITRLWRMMVTVCHTVRGLWTSISDGETTRPRRPHRRGPRTSRSDDLVDPAVRVGTGAVLDADQFLAEPHRDLAGLAVPDRPLAVPALDPADRADDRGGAAAEHLGE